MKTCDEKFFSACVKANGCHTEHKTSVPVLADYFNNEILYRLQLTVIVTAFVNR